MNRVLKFQVHVIYLFMLAAMPLSIYAQSVRNLDQAVKANGTLFNKNIDKSYKEIDKLLQAAKREKNYSAELILLDRKCRYYYSKNQIDDLITSAEDLDRRATTFSDNYFRIMANTYLAESYSINSFYDRAILYLDKAYSISKNDNSGQKKIFVAKANVLNSYANIYSDKGEPKKAVRKLREVIKSYGELNNDKDIDQFQYVNYSNIASIYIEYDIDSAKYFAMKSIALKPASKNEDSVMMMNYFILGQAYEKSNNNEKAISYFLKSLTISDYTGMELNKKLVYSSLVNLYKKNNRTDSAIIYENKLKQMEISMLESKYNSLKKVMSDDKNKEIHTKYYLIYLFITVLILAIVTIFVFKKKYSKQRRDPIMKESFVTLREMAIKNDPDFIYSFEKFFPNFSTELLKLSPELQKTEIEFCALLKLNLSTKEISTATFIERKTVQNKKYRIRKKLGIPPQIDIYVWFTNFGS